MSGKRRWVALAVLGGYFAALLMFQSRLTWENFDRQLHITEIARPPFTLGPASPLLNALRPEASAAGLLRGDRLIRLGGALAQGQQSPQVAAQRHKAGQDLPVTVERDGVRINASIPLQALSREPLTF